jgi:hypothetical protein
VTVEYASSSYAKNQVAIWDKILLLNNEGFLDLRNQHVKYRLADKICQRNATIILRWNSIPNAGRLAWYAAAAK